MTLADDLDARGATALDGLAHSVEKFPDKTAILYGETGQAVTYARLGADTDSIAGNLTRLGVGKGARVGVFTSSPLHAVLAMYGIWKAGAVYAPVNPALVGRLLAYQLNDTRPSVLILDADLAPSYAGVEPDLLEPPTVVRIGGPRGDSVASFEDLLVDAPRPDVTVTFSDPASIIYTSGTTGPAKGVLQPHRWGNQYTWIRRQMFTADDVIYCDLPMYHVGGTLYLVGTALWVGATVSLWDRFSRTDFWDRVRSTGVSAAAMVDVAAAWLLANEPADSDRDNSLNKLYLQPLPQSHHEFATRFGVDFMTASFAQSEVGTATTAFVIQNADGEGTPPQLWKGLSHLQMRQMAKRLGLAVLDGDRVTRKGLMGGPGPILQVMIMDELDQECGPEQIGQLCVRPNLPSMLLDEYIGKPEKTLEAVRNLWFHTGDAALRGDDGLFYYVDRMGDRMRIRGENVGSAQVEELLATLPSVVAAAVFAVPAEQGAEDEVVAYLEPSAGGSIDLDEVRALCERTMPRFMRPGHLRVIDALPRTPTNKVQKYQLRTAFLASLGADTQQ